MKNKKAIVAGHICVDITPVFPGEKVDRLDSILLPGKLIRMDGVSVNAGGVVVNTGLAMKIFGQEVSLMGKVGEDSFGDIVENVLASYGASEGLIRSADCETSYTVVLAVPGIDRIFLHAPAANDTFCSEDLDWEKVGEADLFHFGYPPLMKNMYEQDGEELEKLLRRAKETGVIVSLDLAAVDPASEAGRADWQKILARVLPHVDFFEPSLEELCFMLDGELYRALNDRAAGREITEVVTYEEIRALGQKVMELGAKVVLIKCGAPGLYYRTASADTMRSLCEKMQLCPEEWEEKEGFEKSYQPEIVRSGTGAGDVSIAAFLCGVLGEESLEEAMHLAAAGGASCVTTYDALSGLMHVDKLKEKIRGGWKKTDL